MERPAATRAPRSHATTKADDAALAAWTVEVLTAETLERVFGQGATPAAPKPRALPLDDPPLSSYDQHDDP